MSSETDTLTDIANDIDTKVKQLRHTVDAEAFLRMLGNTPYNTPDQDYWDSHQHFERRLSEQEEEIGKLRLELKRRDSMTHANNNAYNNGDPQ